MRERLSARISLLVVALCFFAIVSEAQTSDTSESASDQAVPIQLGQPIHTVNPKVPKELRKKIVVAVFSGTISSVGEFRDLTALGGDPVFTTVARDAVGQWRYSPPTQEGKPVDAKVYVIVYADKGKIWDDVEPELPLPMQPHAPIKEQIASSELSRVGGRVTAPRAIFAPDPEYSELARKARYQGVALLGVIVGPDGKPHDVWVVKKLGLGLDQKAIDAVRTWTFEPATRDGEPVAVLINIEVSFRLY